MYRDVIDRYALVHGFQDEALGHDDWNAIKIVAEWLRLFRKATTRMSSRDKTTISSVFAVFVSLQNHVRAQLRELPDDVPVELKAGLVQAHEKLAEYFKKSDASPYYLWAACKCTRFVIISADSLDLVVLDPRVTYHGALEAASDDLELRSDIRDSHAAFIRHYHAHYSALPTLSGTSASDPTRGSPTEQDDEFFSLFTRGRQSVLAPQQELDTFLSLRPDSYSTSSDPVKWWASRRSQFPRLSRMARDIFSIPGQFLVLTYDNLSI
jgi:hypothetical protein